MSSVRDVIAGLTPDHLASTASVLPRHTVQALTLVAGTMAGMYEVLRDELVEQFRARPESQFNLQDLLQAAAKAVMMVESLIELHVRDEGLE